jgi:hypothetical protein
MVAAYNLRHLELSTCTHVHVDWYLLIAGMLPARRRQLTALKRMKGSYGYDEEPEHAFDPCDTEVRPLCTNAHHSGVGCICDSGSDARLNSVNPSSQDSKQVLVRKPLSCASAAAMQCNDGIRYMPEECFYESVRFSDS